MRDPIEQSLQTLRSDPRVKFGRSIDRYLACVERTGDLTFRVSSQISRILHHVDRNTQLPNHQTSPRDFGRQCYCCVGFGRGDSVDEGSAVDAATRATDRLRGNQLPVERPRRSGTILREIWQLRRRRPSIGPSFCSTHLLRCRADCPHRGPFQECKTDRFLVDDANQVQSSDCLQPLFHHLYGRRIPQDRQ